MPAREDNCGVQRPRRRIPLGRLLLVIAAVLVALAPALSGLRGNDSLAHDVPVAPPRQATPSPTDEARSASADRHAEGGS